MSTEQSEIPNQADHIENILCNREQDANFQRAMLRAIHLRQEHAPFLIDKRPCTERPVFVKHGYMERGSSPAMMCAELGGSAGNTF